MRSSGEAAFMRLRPLKVFSILIILAEDKIHAECWPAAGRLGIVIIVDVNINERLAF